MFLIQVESAVSENEQIATELLDEKAATAHATSGHKRLDLSKANRSNRMLIKQVLGFWFCVSIKLIYPIFYAIIKSMLL